MLWWNRIIVHHKKIKGWTMSPSHFLGTHGDCSASSLRHRQSRHARCHRAALRELAVSFAPDRERFIPGLGG
jgi:hypothetical protein